MTAKGKRTKQKFIAWMDYDKEFGIFQEAIYFKKPQTRHSNPTVVSRKVKVQEL